MASYFCLLPRLIKTSSRRSSLLRWSLTSQSHRSCHAAATSRLGHSILPNSDTNDLKTFDDTFPIVVQNLLSDENGELKDFNQHLKKVVEYNVPYGKKLRGLATMVSYRLLHKNPQFITKEELLQASLMGWCIEMLQAGFLISDDIIDQSHTRRGRQCWFRNGNVGLSAINDALLLQSGLFKVLRNNFSSELYYTEIVDVINEIFFKTCAGQSLDSLRSCRENEAINFKGFTIENYSVMIKYKTSYYSFYLPVALALYMNGISDKNVHNQARDVLLDMGHLFQIQDDFLDCFGKPSETGKLGTDVAEGKCTWLAVTALQLANSDQMKIMVHNYGQQKAECVDRIRDLYVELKLPSIYAEYEQSKYEQILSVIQNPTFALPENVFNYCLSLIYKRRS